MTKARIIPNEKLNKNDAVLMNMKKSKKYEYFSIFYLAF